VVGWATETTAQTSSCGELVQFSTPEEALPGVLAELRALGVEHIIGLSHSGYDVDQRLAAEPELRDLDLIIGAHTHSFLYDGPPPPLLVSYRYEASGRCAAWNLRRGGGILASCPGSAENNKLTVGCLLVERVDQERRRSGRLPHIYPERRQGNSGRPGLLG
jgi:hypothetical protein